MARGAAWPQRILLACLVCALAAFFAVQLVAMHDSSRHYSKLSHMLDRTPRMAHEATHDKMILAHQATPQAASQAVEAPKTAYVASAVCAVCGITRTASGVDANCCNAGASWAGQCGEGRAHTYEEGWHACNSSPDHQARRSRDVLLEHGDPLGHFGRGMKRVAPWASHAVVHGGQSAAAAAAAGGKKKRRIGVFYLYDGAQENGRFFADRGLVEDDDEVHYYLLLVNKDAVATLLRARCEALDACEVFEEEESPTTPTDKASSAFDRAVFSDDALHARTVLLTSQVRGPFLPKYWTGGSWARALADRLQAGEWLLATAVDLDHLGKTPPSSSKKRRAKQPPTPPEALLTSGVRVSLDRAAVVLDVQLARQFAVRGFGLGGAFLEREAVAMCLMGNRGLRVLAPPWDGVDWAAYGAIRDRARADQELQRAIGGKLVDSSGGVDHVLARLFVSPGEVTLRAQVARYTAWIAQAPTDWHAVGRSLVAARAKTMKLVAFAYYEKDAEARANFQYFLDVGLEDLLADPETHVVVVINGPATVRIPIISSGGSDDDDDGHRFKVVARKANTCLDFGAWGIALAAARQQWPGRDVATLLVLNSSVRGPFVVPFGGMRWADGFLSLLRGSVALAGLAVNCPDGAGQATPHVMSMAMVMDARAVALAERHGYFACAESYEVAVKAEGALSRAVLAAGLNIDSMQWSYAAVDWRAQGPTRLTPNAAGFSACPGIALDVFYREAWYFNETAHPYEFLFYKTNRNVNAAVVADLSKQHQPPKNDDLNRRRRKRKRALLASHNLDGDGAPRYLANLAEVLHGEGYDLVVLALERDGVTREVYDRLGATILVPTAADRKKFGLTWDRVTLAAVLAYVGGGGAPDVVVLNTILWANAVRSHNRLVQAGGGTKVIWVLHEIEIDEPPLMKKQAPPFWFGDQFDAVQWPQRCDLVLRADAVVFVSEAQRALWSDCDVLGHFFTLRGRPADAETDGTVVFVETKQKQQEEQPPVLAKDITTPPSASSRTPRIEDLECYATRYADVRTAFCVVVKGGGSTPFFKGGAWAWACDWASVAEHRHALGAQAESRVLDCGAPRPPAVMNRAKATVTRASLHIPESGFVMTTVGTLCLRKRQVWALVALQMLLVRREDAYLVLVGAPSEAGGRGDPAYVRLVDAFLDRHSSAKNRTFLVPFSSDVAAYLRLADLHLSPSRLEAYPLNTLEAMALGIPVIATAAGGTDEQFVAAQAAALVVRNLTHPHDFVQAVLDAHAKRGPRLKALGAALQRTAAAARQTFATKAAALVAAAAGGGRRQRPDVTFVVRTYAAQVGAAPYSLEACLASLVRLENPAWEALVVRSDRQPGLYAQALAALDDARIRFVAPHWAPEVSSGGYEVTDAIIALARSRWLVITNGDNTYAPTFLNHLYDVDDYAADLVAFDFYSRYVAILDEKYVKGPGCERYFADGIATCKTNLLAPWHTDLGANVLNLYRWRAEGRTYDSIAGGTMQEQDGFMARSLRYWGWRVRHVAKSASDGCLFSHNPNIHSCLAHDPDMVWLEGPRECANRSRVSLSGNHHQPFFAAHLPPGTAGLQGRCYD